ncbi:hydrogenase maturation protease [Methanococcoides alaskense]|uniref:Hydrogenase maturation protease n=1 Tax=Methanococcoides alaskense TaxID=325778 RepID=A0AA90TY68_9EURY|nr:hydrogenase maturation protease [Methanococcoides alaskense]MDA0524892.1 hydrogenase maturation protease [Methanococcoides alaskense]MDR6222194.1 hydrogenase maturation protease [Methanococcoides alaskense]
MSEFDPSLRIIGCGNILMGDDGVGVRVVEALEKMGAGIPEDIDILDAGVCGLDILNLLEDVDKVIIVDSMVGSGSTKRGSILRFELEDLLNKDHEDVGIFSAHDISISDILSIGKHVQDLPEIIVFGIEIGEVKEELSMDLSSEVLDAVERVIPYIIEEMVGTS